MPDHTDPISEIYAYFTDGSNEDAFKADVSALATQASVDTIDGIVDAIKVKTDELTFTVPGSVDATATATVDSSAIANAVWEESKSSHTTAGTFGYNLDAQVSLAAITRIGSGAISHEITVNVAGSPEDGVEVWVTTDSSGTNVVAGTLVTDAFGKAQFMLDAGSYYLWAQKSGANFTNPTSFSVS